MKRKVKTMGSIKPWVLSTLLMGALALLAGCTFGTPTPTPTPISTPAFDTQYGVANINPALSYDATASAANISAARNLGAEWDRWVVQWFWVDQPWLNNGTFTWNGQFALNGDVFDVDAASAMAQSMAPGINTLVVFHGVPRKYDCVATYATSDFEHNTECDINTAAHNPRIEGLFDPATGGTNRWGNYVNAVTSKLVPLHITYFETWNEPDKQWMDGGDASDPERKSTPPTDSAAFMNDYVQMVKTTLDSAAPGSNIILGAPQSPGDPVAWPWGQATWQAVNADATTTGRLRAAAIHSYEWPFRTWQLAELVRSIFTNRPNIPIWVTESGLHKFDSLDNLYEQRQAAYVFQEAAYARLAGVEVDMHFGMRDTTETNSLGTPIPQLGLYNASATPFPAASVFPLTNAYLSDVRIDQGLSLIPAGVTEGDFANFVSANPYTRMVFNDATNNRRITLVWANQATNNITASIPIWSTSNTSCVHLYDQEGNDQTSLLKNSGGAYSLPLPPADGSSVNMTTIGTQQLPLVGGPGYLLVETPCAVPYMPRIDLVVVMDTTGSMGSSIQGAKNVAVAYVDQLASSGIDYRAAVVDYKDKLYDAYGSRVDLPFTTDRTAIVSAINALYAGGGGDTPEDVYSGVMTAINLPWRSGAKKVVVLMGDAGPHDPESGTGFQLSSVIAAANAVDPANIYAIRVGSDPYMRSIFQQLADGTGGLTFDTSYNSADVSAAILRMLGAVAGSPSAVIGASNAPITGVVGTPIHFDGSHSFDPNGSIVRYEWDFNNDGAFDAGSSNPATDYTYTSAYSGPVRLLVTDNDGNSADVQVPAVVSGAPLDTTPPVITITSPLAQPYLHTDNLIVSWSATDAGSGILSSSASLDGSAVINGQAVDLFYLSLGTHTLTVSATDQAGNSAELSLSFTVVADINSLIAAEQRACSLGWIDGNGVCNSLEAKLRAAKTSIDHGKFSTARNQLNAFINELNAQNGKKVTQGYDMLKDDTLYVINHLP